MKKETFDITGMTCSACSARVEKAVKNLPGAENVSVNLLTNSMQISFDEKILDEETIVAAVTKAGYGAAVRGKKAADNEGANINKEETQALKERFCRSLVFLLPTIYIAMHGMIHEAMGIDAPQAIKNVFDGGENAVTFAFSQFLLLLPVMYFNRRYYIYNYYS